MGKFKRLAVGVSTVVTGVLVTAGQALATPYDMADVTSGFGAQITEAVTTALPVAGTILAFFVGWKIVKRVTRG